LIDEKHLARRVDRETLERDIAEGSLYGIFTDGTLGAVVALNHYQDKEYAEIDWSIDDPKPLVVHRLCVDPVFQGRGLAKAAIAFAERMAAERGCASIRLDAFTLNPISLSLYRSLGFEGRGTVRFRKGLFICFEKPMRLREDHDHEPQGKDARRTAVQDLE
jgi:RimJ/RimL family protein N-acetyltransferase